MTNVEANAARIFAHARLMGDAALERMAAGDATGRGREGVVRHGPSHGGPRPCPHWPGARNVHRGRPQAANPLYELPVAVGTFGSATPTASPYCTASASTTTTTSRP